VSDVGYIGLVMATFSTKRALVPSVVAIELRLDPIPMVASPCCNHPNEPS